MGDNADAILDGLFCETCGECLEESVGYPRRCDECEREYNDQRGWD